MDDQAARLEEIVGIGGQAVEIIQRFTNDQVGASLIPTSSGPIKNLKQVTAEIKTGGETAISTAVVELIDHLKSQTEVDVLVSSLSTAAVAASESAARSELSASSAAAIGNSKMSIAQGLLETSGTGSTNRVFSVFASGNYLSIHYLNDNGAAVEIGRSPSALAIEAINTLIFSRASQVVPGATHMLTDKSGGVLAHITEDGTFYPALRVNGVTGECAFGDLDNPMIFANPATGAARLGDVRLLKSLLASGFADASGGMYLAVKDDLVLLGSDVFSDEFHLAPDGSLAWAAPIDGWKGPGAADAHYGPAAAPVVSVPEYSFPTFTRDRKAVPGKDMKIMQAVSIPRVAAWPGGMVLRACYGKSGVPNGESAEGKGSHIRIDRNDGGDRWRSVGYIHAGRGISADTLSGTPNLANIAGGHLVAGEPVSGAGIPDGAYVVSYDSAAHTAVLSANATLTGALVNLVQIGQACLDCFIHRLPDNRALLVFPHLIDKLTGGPVDDLHHATALVIDNPQDDPANWIIGPMCRVGDGFPSLPVPIDNGDLVGCIATPAPRINAGTGANVFGFYTVDAASKVSFTPVGTVPVVAGSVSFCESRVVQTAANTLCVVFRTSVGTSFTTSTNRGLSWAVPAPLPLTSIPAAVSSNLELQRLPDGRLLAAHNWEKEQPASRYNMWVWLWDYGAAPTDSPVALMKVSERALVTYPNFTCLLDAAGHWRGEVLLAFDRGRGNVVTDNLDPTGYSNDLIDVKFCVQALSLKKTNFSSRTFTG